MEAQLITVPFVLAILGPDKQTYAIEAEANGLVLRRYVPGKASQQWVIHNNPINGAPVQVAAFGPGEPKFVVQAAPGGQLKLGTVNPGVWHFSQHESIVVYKINTDDVKQTWQVEGGVVKEGAKVVNAFNAAPTSFFSVAPVFLQ